MKNSKLIIFLLIALALYTILQVIPFGKTKHESLFKIKQGERPLVIAHGGAKLLNPENTWMAYDFAYNLGVDVLEMDLQITKDGQLITYHNSELEDLSDAEGLVSEYTYEELKQFNFGENFMDLEGNYPYKDLSDEERLAYGDSLIPANLESMFEKYGDDVIYICELKNKGELGKKSADKMIELLKKYGLEDKVCVASFNKETLDYFIENAPDNVITSFDMKTATSFVIANYLGYGIFMDYPQAGLQLPMSQSGIPLDLKYLVYKIHKNDMFVHYWTVNEKSEMKKCIEIGADGVITDRPDLLFEVLQELGYTID